MGIGLVSDLVGVAKSDPNEAKSSMGNQIRLALGGGRWGVARSTVSQPAVTRFSLHRSGRS